MIDTPYDEAKRLLEALHKKELDNLMKSQDANRERDLQKMINTARRGQPTLEFRPPGASAERFTQIDYAELSERCEADLHRVNSQALEDLKSRQAQDLERLEAQVARGAFQTLSVQEVAARALPPLPERDEERAAMAKPSREFKEQAQQLKDPERPHMPLDRRYQLEELQAGLPLQAVADPRRQFTDEQRAAIALKEAELRAREQERQRQRELSRQPNDLGRGDL